MPEQTHDDIRRLLEHVAQDAPAFAPAKEHTVRRARRHVGTNLVTASLVATALFAAVVFGVRALPGPDGAPPVSDSDLPVELYGVNIESGELTPFVRLPEGASNFALSSHADRIAFVLDVDGHPQIFVMNADGSSPVQLTHEPLAALAPAWSPSGSEIAYRGLAADTSYEVIVIDSEVFGTPRRLTSEEQDVSHSLAWTPDGDRILYQTSVWREGAADATQVVRSVDVTTKDTSTILVGACCPDPSPDGSRIVYNTWSRALVTVADDDGSSPRIIPSPSGKSTGYAKWSPDGERIAFLDAGNLNEPEVGLGTGTTYVYDLAKDSVTFSVAGDIVDWIDDQTILVVVA